MTAPDGIVNWNVSGEIYGLSSKLVNVVVVDVFTPFA